MQIMGERLSRKVWGYSILSVIMENVFLVVAVIRFLARLGKCYLLS